MPSELPGVEPRIESRRFGLRSTWHAREIGAEPEDDDSWLDAVACAAALEGVARGHPCEAVGGVAPARPCAPPGAAPRVGGERRRRYRTGRPPGSLAHKPHKPPWRKHRAAAAAA